MGKTKFCSLVMRRSPVRIRLPAPNSPKTSVFGEFYFVVTAADTSVAAMERTREGFRGFADCLPGARDVGEPCRRGGGWSMTIAEVSKRCGLSADTLRYYERIGLIPPVPHSKSGIRDYDEASCGWIEWMKSITRAPPKG